MAAEILAFSKADERFMELLGNALFGEKGEGVGKSTFAGNLSDGVSPEKKP